MAPVLGVIADDFTGALLIAGLYEAAGVRAPVFFDPDAVALPADAAIAILAMRTRVSPVAEALADVARGAAALRRAGCARLSYKACASFDSTAEGNIGPAARFLSDEAGGAPVLMSAGFPRYNVTVHQGYLFYRGRLVTDSVKRLDPLTPMEDPDLARFLSAQTGAGVGLVPHKVLRQGIGAAAAEWAAHLAAGLRYVLADTSDDGDVEVSAELALQTGAVVVASDSLIVAYGLRLAGPRAAALPPPALPQGPGAVLVGSVGQTAGAQVARFGAEHPVWTVDPADPRADQAVIAEALDWAAPRLGPAPFCIATLGDEAAVARAQARLGAIGAARRAERILGAIALGLRDRGLRRLVVSGGETSGAVVAALGLCSVRVLPDGPLGSGFCLAEGPEPMGLFLKSGKIGADDVLLRGLEVLAG